MDINSVNIKRQKRQPLIHNHILYEIFDCMNMSELKKVRLVCRQWCKASRHRMNTIAEVSLGNSKQEDFLEQTGFGIFRDEDLDIMADGEKNPMQGKFNLFVAQKMFFNCRTPVSQLILLPSTFRDSIAFSIGIGYAEADFSIGRTWISMDAKKLDTVFGKFTKGITSFHFGWDEEKIQIRAESILLRPELSNLSDFRFMFPFQISENSNIHLRFRGLRQLHVSINCGKDLIKFILLNCCNLGKLSIGFNDPNLIRTTAVNGVIDSVLDGIAEAFDENECLRETVKGFHIHFRINDVLTDIVRRSNPEIAGNQFAILPWNSESLFKKLLNLKLGLTHGHFAIDLKGSEKPILYGQFLNFLESQKNSMKTLTLPRLPLGTDLQNLELQLPNMVQLEALSLNINISPNFFRNIHLLTKLKTVNLSSRNHMLINMMPDMVPAFERLEECLASNLTPCPSVEKLALDLAKMSSQVLTGMYRLFPNVKLLIVRIYDTAELQVLWTLWPKLQMLHIDVNLFNIMRPLEENDFGQRLENIPFVFNAAIVGLSPEDYRTLYFSNQEFDAVNITAAFNLPSIRNLTELTYLTISTGSPKAFLSNVTLVLGILYLKNLHELNLVGHITIDCAQYVIKSLPLLTRWKLKSSYLKQDPPPREQYFSWVISSKHEKLLEPVYKPEVEPPIPILREDPRKLEMEYYGHRLRSINKVGRNGKSLQCGCFCSTDTNFLWRSLS